MRNLKKILALVLALVMSLSLMATAGAADNSAAANSETISAEYQTAKDVLSALGIFKGYEDGSFKPKQSITRAEVATILYRMVTGDVASARSDIYGDMQQSTFTDLAGANWARGYINYCANAKLIVGVGGNKFQPSANITGYATLAMVLRALGYDKNGEFQGTGWEIRTASTARELGILNNVNAAEDLGKPATREMVAEILFRAMLCEKVQYNALTQDYTKTGETLGYAVFSLEAVQGVVVANQYADIRRHDDGTGYTSPAAKGTTVLRTEDGKDRIIDTESYLNDLGETRVAYTVEKDNLRDTYENLKKIDLENPGVDDITYDGFEAKSSTGARADKDTQYFINFGEEYTDVKTAIKISYEARVIADTISNRTKAGAIKAFCDKFNLDSTVVVEGNQLTVTNSYTGSYQWRIVYTPKTDADVFNTPAGDRYVTHHIYSIVTKNGEMFYRVEIQPNTLLNAADKVMIPAIFNTANLNPENSTQLVVDGQVFKGTQSLYDYSDWKAYEDFAAECLTQKVQDTKVDSNSLGYWLKVIDNDHDGYTDWVFQTRYTVASVSAMTDGVPTLETASWSGHADDLNNLSNASSTVAEDEGLEVGTVVNYAVIDGVARAWKAETVDARVESINRTAATVTTADGTTYKESAVHEHSARTDIDSGVINMAGKTAYILYMDRSGENMAAFSQNITGKFTLLTDGWAHTLKNGTEYAVKAWDQDTQAFAQYDITSGGNMFIGKNDSSNDWNRIRYFNPLNCDMDGERYTGDIETIMAYMETDGENATLMPVDMIYDTQRIEGQRPINMFDMGTQIPTEYFSNGDIWYSGVDGNFLPNQWNDWNGVYGHAGTQNVEIRALSSTVYLYVYRTWYGTTSTMAVRQFTGYKDGSDWMNLRTDAGRHDAYVEDVYVVGTRAWHTDTVGNTNNEYYVADYVVIELNDGFYRDLNTDHEQVFVYDFENVINSVNLEKVKAINAKGEDVELTIDLSRSSRVYYQGANKAAEPAPGLFYLWQTDTSDVWAISRMSHEDIRNAGCYDVGTVGYSRFTSGSNYANIYNWVSNDNNYHWTGCDGDHSNTGTNMMTAGALADNRYNTESSAYYTLSYATGSYGYNSTLGKSSASVALGEAAPDLANGATNEVLVRYNAKNEIVYAISFAHVERINGSTVENYAQKVYRGVLMDADPANWETYLNGVNRELANYAEELKEQYPDKIPAIEAALAKAQEQVNNVPEGRWDDLWNLRDTLREALKDAAVNGENPEVKYDVIIDETIENGTVEADPATAAEGETVTLTAIPDEGYVVDFITVTADDGTEIEVVDKTSFTMPAQNVTVYAAFVEKGDDVTVTFAPATGTETEFNTVELTALEDQTVAEGTDVAPVPGDNIPAAEDVTATMSGLRIALALLKVEDPSAATEDDVWTMDVYTDPVEIPAEDGMTVYYYYYVVEIDETPEDPDDPVDPVDPIDPGEDDGDDIIVVHSASLDPMSGIQTLGLFPDPIDTYCTWMLVKKAVENVYLDDAYEVTNGPKIWTEGMEDGPAKDPSATVLAAYQKYSLSRDLWFVEYKMADGGAFVEPVPSATPPEAKVTVTVTGENVTVEPAGTAFAVGTELTISADEGYTITAAKASVGEVTIAEDKLSATYTVPASEEEITIEVTTAKEGEEDELTKAKEAAKTELTNYAAEAEKYIDELLAAEDLTKEQAAATKEAIQKALEAQNKLIDEVTEEEGQLMIDLIVKDAKAAIDTAGTINVLAKAKTAANADLEKAHDDAAKKTDKANVISALASALADAKKAVTAAETKEAVDAALTAGLEAIAKAGALDQTITDAKTAVDRKIKLVKAQNPDLTADQTAKLDAAKAAADAAIDAATTVKAVEDAQTKLDAEIAKILADSPVDVDPDTGIVTVRYYLGSATELSAEALQTVLGDAYKVPSNYTAKAGIFDTPILDKDSNPVTAHCIQTFKVTVDGEDFGYVDIPASGSDPLEITNLTNGDVYLTGDTLVAVANLSTSTITSPGSSAYLVQGGKISVAKGTSYADVALFSTVQVDRGTLDTVKVTKNASTALTGSETALDATTSNTAVNFVKTGAALWVTEKGSLTPSEWYELKVSGAQGGEKSTLAQINGEGKIPASTTAYIVGDENITITFATGYRVSVDGVAYIGVTDIDTVVATGRSGLNGKKYVAIVRDANGVVTAASETTEGNLATGATNGDVTIPSAKVSALNPADKSIELVSAAKVTPVPTTVFSYGGKTGLALAAAAWIPQSAVLTVSGIASGSRVSATTSDGASFLSADADGNYTMTVGAKDITLAAVTATDTVAITTTLSQRADGAIVELTGDANVKSFTATLSAAAVEAAGDITAQPEIKDAVMTGGVYVVPTNDKITGRDVKVTMVITPADGKFFAENPTITVSEGTTVTSKTLNADGTLTVVMTFTVKAAGTPITGVVAVTLDATPINLSTTPNAKLPTPRADNANVDVTVSWTKSGSSDAVDAGATPTAGTYIATITVQPKAGYSLDGATFTVNSTAATRATNGALSETVSVTVSDG